VPETARVPLRSAATTYFFTAIPIPAMIPSAVWIGGQSSDSPKPFKLVEKDD
jgi:hypothetical protein